MRTLPTREGRQTTRCLTKSRLGLRPGPTPKPDLKEALPKPTPTRRSACRLNVDKLKAVLWRGPSVGTLRLAANGTFTYVPVRGFRGRVTFSSRAFDGVEYSDPVVVTIDVLLAGRRIGP